MKISITRKLLFGLTFTVFSLITVAYFSISTVNGMRAQYEQIIGFNLPVDTMVSDLGYYQMEQISSMRGYMVYKDDSYLKTNKKAKEIQVQIFKQLPQYIKTEKSREFYQKTKNLSQEFDTLSKEVIAAVQAGNMEVALQKGSKGKKIVMEFKETVADWKVWMKQSNEAIILSTDKDTGQNLLAIYIIVAMAGFLSLIVGLILSRSISKPVTALALAAVDISKGNLTVKTPEVNTRDEIKDLAEAFSVMVTNLKELITNINKTSETVAATSQDLSGNAGEAAKVTQQVAATISQVAQGSAEQARSSADTVQVMGQATHAIEQLDAGSREQSRGIVETTSTVNDMVLRIEQMVEGMQTVKEVAEHNGIVAVNGGEEVNKTVNGMLRVKSAVFETARKIHELGEQSQKIGEIIQVIDDLAEQTNLLALNAAIEAARAGEHGKGFAVVADEVRKLAERSGKATKEITELISDIQNGTKIAVESTEVGTKEVEEGVILAQKAGQALNDIVEGVKTSGDKVQEIMGLIDEIMNNSQEVSKAINNVAIISEESTAATEEMSSAAQIVHSSIENVAAISEQNASAAEQVSASTEELTASIEEISASSETLSSMALELKQLVSRFRV